MALEGKYTLITIQKETQNENFEFNESSSLLPCK